MPLAIAKPPVTATRVVRNVDRTGATEVKSHSIFEVSIWKCVKQLWQAMVLMVLCIDECLGLFFTRCMTSPARTDIFRPGEVKNTVSEKLGA